MQNVAQTAHIDSGLLSHEMRMLGERNGKLGFLDSWCRWVWGPLRPNPKEIL